MLKSLQTSTGALGLWFKGKGKPSGLASYAICEGGLGLVDGVCGGIIHYIEVNGKRRDKRNSSRRCDDLKVAGEKEGDGVSK